MKVDFLCVGFPKCGTTTLDEVLRMHTKIALPIVKETGFFSWCKSYDEPVKEELAKYYIDTEGKKVGVIEPLFLQKANEVKEYFGKELKILIMMRNPVDRLFSDFRMKLRFGGSGTGYKNLYKKYKAKEVAEMFHALVKEEMLKEEKSVAGIFHRGEYIRWIQEYEKEFGKENIKLIFMEDFFCDSVKEVKAVLDFIGVPYEKLDTNVRANEGKKISRGYISATINKWIYYVFMKKTLRGRKSLKRRIFLRNIAEWQLKTVGLFTLVESKEKMLPETRKLLQEYYDDGVRALEKYANKDLSGIWY